MAETASTVILAPAQLAVRPQPVGAFALPAGYLLVPAGEDTEAARLTLLSGNVPAPWPARLRAHELALAGDRDGALAALPGDDVVTRYNRFVLDPDGANSADLDALRSELGEFGPLVDVVAFVLGRTDTPPERADTFGEIAALVLSAQAANALGRGAPAEAVALLDEAAELSPSPPLAALMLGAAASVCLENPASAEPNGLGDGGVGRLEKALAYLAGADGLRVGRAELHLALAGALHSRGDDRPDLVAKAIPHYHSTLQLVLMDEAPELWAAAHSDLGAAYLTMPMVEASDQLRRGVAVQSLRNALKVYTRETHPERWASTQLNLANSLVYTPSNHQADNLVEAVEIYESVLEVRERGSDPLGRARVLANQGNALAHLGSFDVAKAKLYEARFIFEEFDDHDSMRAVRGVLDEISRQQALITTEELA